MRTHVLMIVLSANLLTSCTDDGAPREAAGATAAEACAEPPCEEKPNWWASARTVTSDEMNAEIVSCQVGASRLFSTLSACLSRGGVPR